VGTGTGASFLTSLFVNSLFPQFKIPNGSKLLLVQISNGAKFLKIKIPNGAKFLKVQNS
jgi:hypothetical protein